MITIVRHPGGQLQIGGTWVPDDMANADRREIARLLAALAEIIDELAAVVSVTQAPKLHAMQARIAAIRAQER